MIRLLHYSYIAIGFIFLQLSFLSAAGAEKTARSTGILYVASAITASTAYVCDTVPVADTFDFYVSNQGLNSNSGTSTAAPKRYFDSINTFINTSSALNKPVSVGLDATSTFREELDIGNNNIRISSFALQGKNSKTGARITGMNVITAWKATQGKSNVYEYNVNHSVDLTSANYNYVFVAETDTVTEKIFPVSAVKYLTLVSSVDVCQATPGSFTIAPLTQNPITIYIHPSAGIAGSNKYRYEVVTRPFNIYSFYNNNCTFTNLFFQASGNGYGMLGAGENTTVKNVTFQGGGTHHTVIKSGTVDHSVFLPGPKGIASEIALVFYAPDGLASNNTVKNALFLDIQNPVFTHTNGAANYKSLTVDSMYAFADTLYTNTMLSTDNTDSVVISNSYGKGYKNFWVGMPHSLTIKNSIINSASEAVIYLGTSVETVCNATVSNTLITTNSNDANQGLPKYQPSVGFRFAQKSTSLKVSNTIFYGHSTWHTQYATETVFENALNNKLEALNNIYICDVNPENYLHVVSANNASGKGTSSNLGSDYNVYILLKGTIYWTAYPSSPQGDGNIFSLQDWQSFSGQDQHSIFIDLRNNPAGLKAIFTDPEMGNWTLTQSPQADSVRMLNAGMLTPPLYYPLRPVYEDALEYTLPGGISYFTGSRDMNHEMKLDWKTIYEPNLAYFAIESSTDNLNFKNTASVATKGRYKTNLYSFTRTDTSSTRMYYRLRLMNADSTYNFSPTISIDPSKRDSIINGIGGSSVNIILYPNPVQTSVMVEHPLRDDAQINVYDYTGRKLKMARVQPGSSITSLSLAGLPAGKYIIEWTSGKETRSLTCIKGR